jgi:hypothetical protein
MVVKYNTSIFIYADYSLSHDHISNNPNSSHEHFNLSRVSSILVQPLGGRRAKCSASQRLLAESDEPAAKAPVNISF